MLHIALICLGLISADPPAGSPDSTTATQNADALIQRALDLEARGLDDQRHQCLEAALRAEPDNVRARGLLGQVRYHGQWLSAEEAVAREKTDAEQSALLAEYERRRAETKDTPAAHWKLALWCEQAGLKPEATAHLTEVTRLDPQNRSAWLKLGCRLYRGRWQNEEQIASQEAELGAQADADRYGVPV